MKDILKSAREQMRQDHLDSLRDNRRQRSNRFESGKDYNRKNKEWKKEEY